MTALLIVTTYIAYLGHRSKVTEKLLLFSLLMQAASLSHEWRVSEVRI